MVFFGITRWPSARLYLYVAPGLQSRLMGEKLDRAGRHGPDALGPSSAARWAAPTPLPQVRRLVSNQATAPGDRVTLLSVNLAQGALAALRAGRLGHGLGDRRCGSPIAQQAVAQRRGSVTGIEPPRRARWPRRPSRCSTPRRVGGGDRVLRAGRGRHAHRHARSATRSWSPAAIALLLALVAGYLVARALAQRVKRLELAAKQVAAGDFSHPIPVDSTDELGQLAVAFNEMQQQLHQLEQARKKFIATASHELRTPVFSLGGFVELLEDEELDAETRRRFLDQVREQVQRLGKLSVDLLDLSRLESGLAGAAPRGGRPRRADALGVRRVRADAGPARQPARAAPAARRIEAQCDPVRVAQIMRILIDNALTHTPPGTKIVVTAGRDNGHVHLAVRDDGEGIDQRRRSSGSSSPSTPPTTPRARDWGWRSPPSSPIACAGSCPCSLRRGPRRSRSRSRPERRVAPFRRLRASSGSSSFSQTSLRVGNAGMAWTSRRQRDLADDGDRGGVQDSATSGPVNVAPIITSRRSSTTMRQADGAPLPMKLAPGVASISASTARAGMPASSAWRSVRPTAAIWGSVNTTRGDSSTVPDRGGPRG